MSATGLILAAAACWLAALGLAVFRINIDARLTAWFNRRPIDLDAKDHWRD